MAGIDVSKIPKCVTIEKTPSEGSDGPIKSEPRGGGVKQGPGTGGVKTKPGVHGGAGHADGDTMQRGSGGLQRLHPNGSGAAGKPNGSVKPDAPASGGFSVGKPNIFVKPCPPAQVN